MRAIDTNVLVRLITRDDLRQTTLAENFVAKGAWVSPLALAEAVWVLESVYGVGTHDQASAIAEYAQGHGFEITRTYADPGRSGVTLAARKGLQALLSDALAADRGFEAILVYDVSRWGRFQPPGQPTLGDPLCRPRRWRNRRRS